MWVFNHSSDLIFVRMGFSSICGDFFSLDLERFLYGLEVVLELLGTEVIVLRETDVISLRVEVIPQWW